jgi:phosphoglycolate phosphatase
MVKPNPKCLLDILEKFGVAPHNAVYIGDSLAKDVRMAQTAGVHDIYAAYGKQVTPAYYRTLVEITHWTVEDVERERQLQAATVRPSFTITRFAETLGVIRQLDSGQGS